MPEPRPIRWLHLSDLHLGCRGGETWWLTRKELEESVRTMARRVGPPDLLILSGDLTNTGAAEEFALVDRFLDALCGWLDDELGGDPPLVFPVPGNHDLQRPQGMAALPFRVLERYFRGVETADDELRRLHDALWRERDVSSVTPLFAAYQAWLERRILPALGERGRLGISHFPGDLVLEIEPPGAFALCLLGLNSAWQQVRDGDFEGKILLPAEQLHAVLGGLRQVAGGETADVFECARALLVMHHPPDWLSRRGRRIFFDAIYPPERFDLCLHGHLHDARSETVAVAGGRPRYLFQAPSLFGLAHWGEQAPRKVVGYSWGSLTADGEAWIWPLARVVRGDGSAAFVHDLTFPDKTDGVRIRPFYTHGDMEAVEHPDLTAYLEAVVESNSHVQVGGIDSAGSVRGALRLSIERLYMALRGRGDGEQPAGMVRLTGLLPRHRRLLLVGEPGAGKTTFLRFLASRLARDGLAHGVSEGSSRRHRFLGMPMSEPPAVPVLIRCAELARAVAGSSQRRERRWILDLLEWYCEIQQLSVSRKTWRRLLEDGEALLLLDGFHEVADPRHGEAVVDVLGDVSEHWECPIVVTSRPLPTAAFAALGFHVAEIEPFGPVEIERFLEVWVTALFAAPSRGELSAEGERYLARLQEALAAPALGRLAANPVVLTCLGVVHWNEGEVPEGRARVYRAAIRQLIAAHSAQREADGFSDELAWRAYTRLALAMMEAEGGKRSIFELDEAAAAIDGVVARELPDLAPSSRHHWARRWLRFECLTGGVVEEVSASRVRFWHLTFQEFLAALELARLGDGEDPATDGWPLLRDRLDDEAWRETVELYAECLIDEGGEKRVDQLLARVLALVEAKADRRPGAQLLERLLRSLSAYLYRPRPEFVAAWDALRAELRA